MFSILEQANEILLEFPPPLIRENGISIMFIGGGGAFLKENKFFNEGLTNEMRKRFQLSLNKVCLSTDQTRY